MKTLLSQSFPFIIINNLKNNKITMSMDEFGNFDEQDPNTLNFDAGDDDAFASAQDPFAMAGGIQMSNQSNAFAAGAPTGQKHDDYTSEELEIMA